MFTVKSKQSSVSSPSLLSLPFLDPLVPQITPSSEPLVLAEHTNPSGINITVDLPHVPISNTQPATPSSPNSTQSSPSPIPQPYHPMITRSKLGVHKPKLFSTVVTTSNDSLEPFTVAQALSDPRW